MAVSEQSLAQRTFAALVDAGMPAAHLKIPNLIALIPDALELTGKRAAAASDYERLQNSFAAIIAAGAFDLTTITGILFDPLRAIVFPPASTVPCVFLETYEDLVYMPVAFAAAEPIYYSRKGQTLQFRNNGDGSLVTLAGAGSITCSYVPSLTDAARPIPLSFEGAIVQTMVELATRQLGQGKEITEIGGGSQPE